jgi:hypothetical protein
MVKTMRYLFQLLFVLCICITGCSNTNERDTISFKVPLSTIADSIKVMNSLLSSYNEVNYYIDDANVLLIGTKEVGKVDSVFLSKLKLNPLNYTNTDIRIFSIILFLKYNEINSCFRRRDLGVIVYDYKPTKDDKFEDVRYIVLDDGLLDANSSRFKNSQYVLDRKDNLLLIAPVEKNR